MGRDLRFHPFLSYKGITSNQLSPLAETLWPGLAHPLKAPQGFFASLSREEVICWPMPLARSGVEAHDGVDL